MTVNLSALAGAGQQFFDNNGQPLSGGKLYSYEAGTTTPQTTYTTAAGNVAHANPIVLDAAGRIATGEIWVSAGLNYKFVLKTSMDVTIATWDNITGINGTGITSDAVNVQYSPPFTNSTSTNVEAKLAEFVSITDFGAIGDGVANDTVAIQNALDYIDSIGGGTVFVPVGTYNISALINVYNKTTLKGCGKESVIYSTNTTRLGGITAVGTAGSPFTNVSICDLSINSSSVFVNGTPSTQTGGGIVLKCCDFSSVQNVHCAGWSDGGIFGDGCNYSYLTGNFVDETAQAIGFFAFSRDCFNNVVSNNVVTNTGTYNAIHLEGAFGGSPYNLYFTTIANNTVRSAYNHGINIENAQYTTCVGNTVFETGLITDAQLGQLPWSTPPAVAPTYLRSAIFLFGASYSSVTGNICNGTTDYAIVVAANSDRSVVVGNTSYNTGGGLLISDGYGTAATNDVTVGSNNWDIYGVDFQGNVSLSNKTTGLTFENVNQALLPSGGKTLGWYEEDTFTATAVGSTNAGTATYATQLGKFTRIGNTVFFSVHLSWVGHTGTGDMRISGLPYPINGSLTRACSIDNVGIASGAGEVMSALLPQGGVSYISLRKTNQTTGAISAIPIQADVASLTISGQYQV